MGGSGGGGFFGGPSPGGADDLSKLEGIARQQLKMDTPSERKRSFISFREEDKGLVEYLRGQAKNTNSNLDFIDMSLKVPFNSKNAEYIKQGIRARLKQCSVTTVMMTDETHKSDWVNWEIRETIKLDKNVIVIDKRKNKGSSLPAAVNENKKNITIVPWKHKNIMDAINNTTEKK